MTTPTRSPRAASSPSAPAPASGQASPPPAPGFSSAPPQAEAFIKPNPLEREILLASGGIPYKLKDGSEGVPGGRVKIIPMTGEEEAILNSPALTEQAKISKIIETCLILPRTGIRHKDLLLTDRLIALFMIRAISLGAEYKMQAKCGQCARKFDRTINLAASEEEGGLRIEEMPRKKYKDGQIVGEYLYDPIEGIPCTLPTTGIELRLRLLTVADDDFINAETRKGSESKFLIRDSRAVGLDPSFFLRNALCIKAIKQNERLREINHSNPIDVLDLINFLRALPMRDTQYIDHVYAKYEVGIGRVYNAKCPGCGADVEVPLLLTAEFFRATDSFDSD